MFTFLITGFILGLTSNFHCIGMCGPIALAVPVNRKNNSTILFGAFQYNTGRIISYAILGGLVGIIGLSIHTFGVLQWLSILSGLFLIIYAWRKYLNKIFSQHLPTLPIQKHLNEALGKVIKSKNPMKLSMLGMLNGFLPCGMVYAALLNALLTGEILGSALAMVFFGIGTLPAMVGVIYMANKITPQMRSKFNKVVPYFITMVGLLIVLRGLNLGIPYISPEIKLEQKQINNSSDYSPEIKMKCCHSKKSCDK